MTVYHKECGGGPVVAEVYVIEQYPVDCIDDGGPRVAEDSKPTLRDVQDISYWCGGCREQIREEDMWDSNDLCNCDFKDEEHGNGFECPRNLSEDAVSEDK